MSVPPWYARIVTGRERIGRPIGVADAQIAAICRDLEAILATRNTADFEEAGVKLIDPWKLRQAFTTSRLTPRRAGCRSPGFLALHQVEDPGLRSPRQPWGRRRGGPDAPTQELGERFGLSCRVELQVKQ